MNTQNLSETAKIRTELDELYNKELNAAATRAETELHNLYLHNGIGAMFRSTVTQRALAAFEAKDHTVVVVDVSTWTAHWAIRRALEAKSGKEYARDDLAKLLKDKFLIVTGVDPLDATMLEELAKITADANCPLVAVLENRAYNEVVGTLWCNLLARGRGEREKRTS